jgi:hypothetical protein
MYGKIIFVDFENVQNIINEDLDLHTKIYIMVGKNQEKLALDVLRNKFELVNTIELIKVNGTGPNAMDFFIAFYLGKYYEDIRHCKIIIYTKDGGFDPLINHLLEKNIKIIRSNGGEKEKDKQKNKKQKIEKIIEVQTEKSVYEKYLEVSEHFNPYNGHPHPRTKETLKKYFAKDLKKLNIKTGEINEIINMLIENGIITILDKKTGKIKWEIL